MSDSSVNSIENDTQVTPRVVWQVLSSIFVASISGAVIMGFWGGGETLSSNLIFGACLGIGIAVFTFIMMGAMQAPLSHVGAFVACGTIGMCVLFMWATGPFAGPDLIGLFWAAVVGVIISLPAGIVSWLVSGVTSDDGSCPN
jgi:hypothetical protein